MVRFAERGWKQSNRIDRSWPGWLTDQAALDSVSTADTNGRLTLASLPTRLLNEIRFALHHQSDAGRTQWPPPYLQRIADLIAAASISTLASPELSALTKQHRRGASERRILLSLPIAARTIAVTEEMAKETGWFDPVGPVRWVGCGPMAELAAVLTAAPEYAEQVVVTQMGGWLDHYRDFERASHNIRTDMSSADLALRKLPRPRLVLSEHTRDPGGRGLGAARCPECRFRPGVGAMAVHAFPPLVRCQGRLLDARPTGPWHRIQRSNAGRASARARTGRITDGWPS
ncbi:hypothetical protein IU450_34170 [Nocardia abscessus]|uniref:hypothetical protein n=1 Tax=Nocardia abscessus TaxID=120957 RepID=UPI0018958C0E|nr:hypothetical protein [Nocardia abscessus]MBF6340900.1 hypothetical protein [Nocardia abscessus]